MQEPKRPSVDLVREYVSKFRAGNAYVADEALAALFSAYPKNDRLEIVLLKVAALNTLYRTGILAVELVARHVHALQIDGELSRCSDSLVQAIAVVQIRNTKRRNYSFATKYCGWHRPDDYPMYDGFVDRLLRSYQRIDGFARFVTADLLDYPTFKLIIDKFRSFYGLSEFTYKQLNNFLWLHGKECFGQ